MSKPLRRSEPFRALLEQALEDAGPESDSTPGSVRASHEESARSPTRSDQPRSRKSRRETLADEPTHRRRPPKASPAPIELEAPLPQPEDELHEEHSDDDDATTSDLTSADLDSAVDFEEGAGRIDLPKSIASATNLFQAARAERPLDQTTQRRISPFDPSSVADDAVDDKEHAPVASSDPIARAPIRGAVPSGSFEDDRSTANGDEHVQKLMAYVRQEQKLAGHPAADSIDLDALLERDDDATVSRRPSNSRKRRKKKPAAVTTTVASKVTTTVAPSKPRPFASLLAESVRLEPVVVADTRNSLPPEFSLEEVTLKAARKAAKQAAADKKTKPRKNPRTTPSKKAKKDVAVEARNERAPIRAPVSDLVPMSDAVEPQFLEPVEGVPDAPFLPVAVGTPTCHWQVDADGRPTVVALSLQEGSAPIPVAEITRGVDEGSIRLDELGIEKDEFEAIREHSGVYTVIPNSIPADVPFERIAAPTISREVPAEIDTTPLSDGAHEEDSLQANGLLDDDSVLADVSLSGFMLDGVDLSKPSENPALDEPTAEDFGHVEHENADDDDDEPFADDSLGDLSLSDLSLSDLSLADHSLADHSAQLPSTSESTGEQRQVVDDDNAISTADLPIQVVHRQNSTEPQRAIPVVQMGPRTPAPPVDAEAAGISVIPLRESVAHLRQLSKQPERHRPPLSHLKVEGQEVSEAARFDVAVPIREVRPPMTPPARVARPQTVGAEGDRLRKGHDLYLLALEKLEAGRGSEALLNAKLATAYDPKNQGYRDLTAFLNEASGEAMARPAR